MATKKDNNAAGQVNCASTENVVSPKASEISQKESKKTIALYLRVSTSEQNSEMQRLELQRFTAEHGYTIVREYSDIASGAAKTKRPGLQKLLSDIAKPHRGFDAVAVYAGDRIARSVRDFMEILDLLSQSGVEYISLREGFSTEGPLGRAFSVLVGMMAEVERGILISRIKSGMARARLEGRQIGRAPLQVDRVALLRDRQRGLSLNQLAKAYRISKASVCRILKEEKAAVSRGLVLPAPPFTQDKELPALRKTA